MATAAHLTMQFLSKMSHNTEAQHSQTAGLELKPFFLKPSEN